MKKITIFILGSFFATACISAQKNETLDLNIVKNYSRKLSSGKSAVVRALFEHAQIEALNKRDNQKLWELLKVKTKNYSPEEFNMIFTQTAKRLIKDKKTYEKIKARLIKNKNSKKRGSAVLQMELLKLTGDIEKDEESNLDKAVKLIAHLQNEKDFYSDGIKTLHISQDNIAPLKILLIYANAFIDKKEKTGLTLKDNIKQVQLVYPAHFPVGFRHRLIKKTVLGSDDKTTTLMIPNAGYVYGGVYQWGKNGEKINIGVDCSAFLSYATDSGVRLTTAAMEYAWRYLKYGTKGFPSKREKRIFREYVKKLWLKEIIEQYSAVDVTAGEELKAGDLIVWRCDGEESPECRNHTAMFMSGNNDEFLVIEATRINSQDGIVTNYTKVFNNDINNSGEISRLYALRRNLIINR